MRMSVRWKGLGCMKFSDKNILRKDDDEAQDLSRQKITTEIAFIFLKTKIDWKARYCKRIPQLRSTGEETVGIVDTVIFRYIANSFYFLKNI